MKTQFATLTLAVLGGLGAMLMPGISQAANIGYYELCNGQGAAYQAAIITAGGGTAVNITTPNAAQLAGVSTLLVTNCDNGGYAAAWTANLADISARVQGGMALVFFDRAVTGANAQLPGGSGLDAVRDFSDDMNIDLPSNSPLLTSNGGPVTQTSLDNGSSSSHGYVTAASLPAGGVIWAHRTAPSEGVVIRYPFGSGSVVYSTIPADYYLEQDISQGLPAAVAATVQATAGLHFQTTTTCASSGYTGTQLLWCQKICESGLTGKELDVWLQRWIRQFRKLPYCALPGGNPPPPPPGD
ncbi:MAG: hypothetical protein KGL71_11350 [Xanthomonadaceae bacterium]|nr:hypothetical protein [Xanthomonadaceae bacterium]